MWFPLSLIALLCWSGSDLFSKVGSKPDDKLSHWKMVIAVGLVMGIHAAYVIFVQKVPINLSIIIRYLPASALYISSMVLGYIALRYIELSVSSPICNSSGALASLIMIIFFFKITDFDSSMQLYFTIIGIVVCGAGVVGLGFAEMGEDDVSRNLRQQKANIKYSKSLIALIIPFIYCLLDAAGTVADSFIIDSLNADETVAANMANTAYELTFLFMAVIGIVYVYIIKKDKFTIKREWAKGVGGLCETVGQLAYVLAISFNPVSSAPIISSYCALSVVWSRVFLKEKLSWKHYVSIAVTIAGIIILGCLDA